MKTLYLIPARGGSERLPGKNLRLLGGKVLLHYSIDIARKLADDCHICVSTDSEKIRMSAEAAGLCVPFMRPADLATREATSESVILHALQWHGNHDQYYDRVVLLQPTSPFRLTKHITEALQLCTDEVDLVVSVDEQGQRNGSIYVYNVRTFYTKNWADKIIEYPMPYLYSIDINYGRDLFLAEQVLKEIQYQQNRADGYREFES